jgi:hypothetical protein
MPFDIHMETGLSEAKTTFLNHILITIITKILTVVKINVLFCRWRDCTDGIVITA